MTRGISTALGLWEMNKSPFRDKDGSFSRGLSLFPTINSVIWNHFVNAYLVFSVIINETFSFVFPPTCVVYRPHALEFKRHAHCMWWQVLRGVALHTLLTQEFRGSVPTCLQSILLYTCNLRWIGKYRLLDFGCNLLR